MTKSRKAFLWIVAVLVALLLIFQFTCNAQWNQPRVLTGLLSQTGTNAPQCTILYNSLSDKPVWTYVAPGTYRASFSRNVLIPHRTWYYIAPGFQFLNDTLSNKIVYVQPNQFLVTVKSGDNALGNDTPFEIRIYSP